MSTPDVMPILSAGAHSGPHEGACVMEYASLLAGEEWSDTPACTHPVLARMAQIVNDRLLDDDRHLLLPLLPRLMGTAPTGIEHEQHVLCVRLAVWAARHVLPMVRELDCKVCQAAVRAAEGWCEGTVAANAAAYPANVAYAANAAANAAYAAYAANVAYAANAVANAAAASAAKSHALIATLTGLLDEHDRLTGHTQYDDLTEHDYARMVAATA